VANAPSSVVIDSATLPPEEARAWADLVDRAGFFSQPAQGPSAPGADRRQFEVTVEDADRRHTVHLLEGAVPPGLKPLLQRLQQAAREALAARVKR
jgi:hypothetical protein